MANQDLTTWTEVDPNGWLSVTSSTITFTGLTAADDTTCVYKDQGAAFYSGNFKFRVGPIQVTAVSDLETSKAYFFSVSLTLPGSSAQQTGRLGIRHRGTTTEAFIELSYNAAANNSATPDAADSYSTGGGAFYVEMERSGANVTAKIYSDAYTTLLDTLAITPGTTDSYRYVVAPSPFRVGSGATISGTIQNIDLDVSSGGSIVPQAMANYRMRAA